MAIYGIGYHYGQTDDKSSDFKANNCICVGWEKDEAPAVFQMLNQVKIGDLVYLKTRNISAQELIIKGVGIILEDEVKKYPGLGNGISVKWIWGLDGSEVRFNLRDQQQFSVYSNTFYEEFHPEIQKLIVKTIFP